MNDTDLLEAIVQATKIIHEAAQALLVEKRVDDREQDIKRLKVEAERLHALAVLVDVF